MEKAEWIAKYWGPDTLRDDLDWSAGGRVHNWRNYIGSRTRQAWPGLSYEARLALALDADNTAGEEDWD